MKTSLLIIGYAGWVGAVHGLFTHKSTWNFKYFAEVKGVRINFITMWHASLVQVELLYFYLVLVFERGETQR